jgi:hypothetical protein
VQSLQFLLQLVEAVVVAVAVVVVVAAVAQGAVATVAAAPVVGEGVGPSLEVLGLGVFNEMESLMHTIGWETLRRFC